MQGTAATAIVLDEQSIWLVGLACVLTRIGFAVLTFGNEADAREAVRMQRPAVFVVDPDGAGGRWRAVIASVRLDSPTTKVIAVADSDAPEDVRAALDAGAAAYVLKTSS